MGELLEVVLVSGLVGLLGAGRSPISARLHYSSTWVPSSTTRSRGI
jgi:hypothetical protein